MKRMVSFLIVFLLIVLVCSCDMFGKTDQTLGTNDSTKYGSISIELESFMAKTITPVESDIKVSKYIIEGTYKGTNSYGSNAETSFSESFTGKVYTKEKLIAGDWEITVSSYNSANKIIASKTDTVGIVQNQTASYNPQLEYVTTGTGSLQISFTVPSSADVDKVHVKLTSTSDHLATVEVGSNNKTPTVVEYNVTTSTLTGTSNVFTNTKTEIESGQYDVAVTMYSGTNLVGLPLMESVHIHKNMTSVFNWIWDESFFDNVSQVSFSPAAGVYEEGQSLNVTLSLIVPDPAAQILYTIDGTDPSTSNTAQVYSSAISISSNTTIKACGKKNSVASDVVSSLYEVQVQSPIFSVDSGSYPETKSLTLSSNTPGSTIYYKVDNGSFNTYSSKLTVSKNATVIAYAAKSGFKNSENVTKTYVIDSQNVALVVADPVNPKVFIAIPNTWGEEIPLLVPGISATLESNYNCAWYLDGEALTKYKSTKALKLGTGTDDVDIEEIGGHIITAKYVTNGRTYTANYCFITSQNGIGSKGASVARLGSDIHELSEINGGYIFYDKGHYTDGWRYLVAAKNDLSGKYKWGIKGCYLNTDTAIGSGKENSERIPSEFSTGVKSAAKACLDYVADGFSDWFLPSIDELNLMYINLGTNSLGGFSYGDTTYGHYDYYLSSSERDYYDGYYYYYYAWAQNFYNGMQGTGSRNDDLCVRAIRAF